MTSRIAPTIVERRPAARTRVFNIEEMDLEFTNGARRTYERVLGSEEGAVLVIPVDVENLILVREYAAGMNRYELTFVKGNIDPGEDALRAANRELQEETGLAARNLRHIRSMTTAPGYLRHSTHVILATGLYDSPQQGDEPEPLEVIPWPMSDLDALLDQEEFTDARSVASLLLLQREMQR